MTRQHISRTNQQSKGDTPLVSGVLQRAAVRTVPEKDVQPIEEETTTFRESRFHHDFSQVPVSTSEIPKIQPKLKIGAERSPLPQQQLSQHPTTDTRSSSVGDGVIQEKGELTGKGQESSLEPRPNNTGLPDRLKTGIESLSGYSMDDVRVHYNSDKPAQLQAHAYAQGTDIHVASGQEKYLPHEAWHFVQQMQGRVKPTMQMKGVQINDEQGLEREADVMGKKAISPVSKTETMIQKKTHIKGCNCSSCSRPIQLSKTETVIQKKTHIKGCNCSSCSRPIQPKLKGDVIQLGRGTRKIKTAYNEFLKGTDSARSALTKASGISYADFHLQGIRRDNSMTETLLTTKGESAESHDRGNISYLKTVLPKKGTQNDGNKRWNDAEMNALAKLDDAMYSIPDDYQSFHLSIKTSIPMCKYCRRRINFWKNEVLSDWGTPIALIIST